jgi:GT2 family glycosyltransferase
MDYEIIVVDNSTKMAEKYQSEDKRIRSIDCINKGFGNACNIGAENSLGEYLLFLNSDTIIEKNTLTKAVRYIRENSRADIVGIKIMLKNGKLDNGCKRGFPTPLASLFYFTRLDKTFPQSRKFGAYHQTFISENETAEVECISGAFMLMKKKTFLGVGGFDEEFFMHGEDIDFCFRASEKGYKTVYFAGASMTHLKGQSSLETSSLPVLKSLYQSMWLFYRKHYYGKYSRIISVIVYGGIKAKYWVSLIKRRFN